MKKISLLIISFGISFATFAQTADTTLSPLLISKAPDVTSVTYQWTKVSGPTAGIIVTPTSLVTQVKDLVVGSYVFQCVPTDNFGVSGLPSVWQIDVIRNDAPPVISAGPNRIVLKTK